VVVTKGAASRLLIEWKPANEKFNALCRALMDAPTDHPLDEEPLVASTPENRKHEGISLWVPS
jgi:hypothetical protein